MKELETYNQESVKLDSAHRLKLPSDDDLPKEGLSNLVRDGTLMNLAPRFHEDHP